LRLNNNCSTVNDASEAYKYLFISIIFFFLQIIN